MNSNHLIGLDLAELGHFVRRRFLKRFRAPTRNLLVGQLQSRILGQDSSHKIRTQPSAPHIADGLLGRFRLLLSSNDGD